MYQQDAFALFSPAEGAVVGVGSGNTVAGTGVTIGGNVGVTASGTANNMTRRETGAMVAEEGRVRAINKHKKFYLRGTGGSSINRHQ